MSDVSPQDKVLTRAGRKRAGLSSPPSHFKDAPKKTNRSTTQPQKSNITESVAASDTTSSSDDEEDSSKKELWVQCEHQACRKWRLLPPNTKVDAESPWYCGMHPDPSIQSCQVPEQKWKRPKKRAYTFSRLQAGQLVWAKMQQFPPWPSIVTPDPWSANEFITEEHEGCIYHVEFLGRVRTHLWLQEEMIEPYRKGVSSLGCVTKQRHADFKTAVREADHLMPLTNNHRLATCKYVQETSTGMMDKLKRKVDSAMEKKVEEKAICNLSSLAQLLSNSSFSLKEFVQTNLKVDSEGMLKLVTSPKSEAAVEPSCSLDESSQPQAKKKRRRRRKGGCQSQGEESMSDSISQDEPSKRQKKRRKKFVSPTIPDYFKSPIQPTSSQVDTSSAPPQAKPPPTTQPLLAPLTQPISALGHQHGAPQAKPFQLGVPTSQPPSNQPPQTTHPAHSRKLDQVVPRSTGDTISSAETLAMKELEEIENLLTLFPNQEEATPGQQDLDHTAKETQSDSKVVGDGGVESLLGEISEIEGLIQDLAHSQVVPY